MICRGFVCLLLGALAWGQAAMPNSAAAPQTPAAQSTATEPAKPAEPPKVVAPDATVITVQGLCDNPPADPSAAADCKTVISRAEFEALINAMAPTMPPAARRQLAERYGNALVMAHQAHALGLDQGPKYEELLKISRMQVMSQLVGESLRDKAGQVPDKDIEDYYQKNIASYQEASLQRLFVPLNKTLPASKVKLTLAETKQRQADAEAAMKTEATALRKRAAAGEDFTKLQQEAYTFAGLKGKPPSVNMDKARRSTLPQEHLSVLDLKVGAVSAVIDDQSGYFVYKLKDKGTLSLEQAKDEIHNTLRSQRMQESMQAMQKMAKTELNNDYFVPPPAPGSDPMMPMMSGRPMPPSKPEPK